MKGSKLLIYYFTISLLLMEELVPLPDLHELVHGRGDVCHHLQKEGALYQDPVLTFQRPFSSA